MHMEFTLKDQGFRTETSFGILDISGDEEHGFRPSQLMISSIAVCSGGVLKKILDKKRIDVQDMTIKADATRNQDKADIIEKIHIHFIIKGKDLVHDRIQKSVEVAHKHCPMVQSVKDSIEVEETFEIINLSI